MNPLLLLLIVLVLMFCTFYSVFIGIEFASRSTAGWRVCLGITFAYFGAAVFMMSIYFILNRFL